MRDEAGWSGLSCWLDRQTNQKNQRDQTDQIDETGQIDETDQNDRYAALEAAFSKSS
jgi:hypothetical protein